MVTLKKKHVASFIRLIAFIMISVVQKFIIHNIISESIYSIMLQWMAAKEKLSELELDLAM